MTFEEIFSVDGSNMYALLKGFPVQVREAVDIGTSAGIRLRRSGIRSIVLCGLGGSAIGGDLLRSYLTADLAVPFFVNRTYTLPHFVGPQTLVIVSSYSGNTEETVAAQREALRRKSPMLCISSGGRISAVARAGGIPLLAIPGGLPPRAALGYSFFPLLVTLGRLGFISDRMSQIRETIGLLERKAAEYGDPDPGRNRALQLASMLRHHVTVVYSSADHLDAVNTRWRGQIAENAKSLCFGHVLPEMNHNELVGWKTLVEMMREVRVLFLRDRDDHPRIALRAGITREVLSRYTPHIEDVWSEGRSPLARIFSLVSLGDWVSYYLAILHRQDPTPVTVIDELKDRLAGV